MLNLKKTAAVVLISSSSVGFAGTMGPVCHAMNVTVPCESSAWDFGGKAIYLQPTLANNTLAMQRTITDNGIVTTAGKNPPYSWGFFLEGSYHFSTGRDLNLNWYHLTHSTTKNFSNASYFLSNNNARPSELNSSVAVGSISMNPQWDAVNLEVGQHVDFAENKSIRFHGGFQFARLIGNTSAIYTLSSGRTSSVTGSYEPTYNGFGPRIGSDLAYDWNNGLKVYANGAAAVLAGTSKYNSQRISNGVSTTVTSVAGSDVTMVPELEAKLGATYTYSIAQGDLSVDAGWMWVNYFNAIQSNLLALVPLNSNFGLQGPFVGLKWLGNIV